MTAKKKSGKGKRVARRATNDLAPKRAGQVMGGQDAYRGRYQTRLSEAQKLLS